MINMSREKHYEAIDHAMAESRGASKDADYMFRLLTQAQIHATLLVEKAIREQKRA